MMNRDDYRGYADAMIGADSDEELSRRLEQDARRFSRSIRAEVKSP